MFNVTVLRMRDIIKFFVGITFVLLIIYISKFFYKEKAENRLAKELADGMKILTSNNMTQCLDETVLAVASVNNQNETSLLDNENDGKITQTNVLENVLKTQISSLKALEVSEKNEEKEKTELMSSTNQINDTTNSTEKKIELARNRTSNTSYYKQSNSREL